MVQSQFQRVFNTTFKFVSSIASKSNSGETNKILRNTNETISKFSRLWRSRLSRVKRKDYLYSEFSFAIFAILSLAVN